ncbi:MAG: DNA polymerase Y family protein [Planctomyces sp.]|nr:DNA polymerase Y family protein [Planctomyces sp.]
MKRVLCVWFPNWPIQRISAARPELKGRPVVLHSALESRLPGVTACSSPAARRGVRIGMPLAEARTLVPSARFFADDSTADDKELRRLAWTCQQFTPRAGLEEAVRPESLFLDVTGCEAHFKSIPQLCEQIAATYRRRGYRVRIAAAATWGAAWAAAHTMKGQEFFVLEQPQLHETLSPLPIWGLRLPPETLLLLAECGLRTIGQLLHLPRSSLPSRFGAELLRRVDQALGVTEELLKPEWPPQPIRAKRHYEFPLQSAAAFSVALQRLFIAVLADLKQRQQQTQRLQIIWKTEEGGRDEFEIRLLRPTSRSDRFEDLLSLQLEQRRFPGGVTFLQVEATPCRAAAERPHMLFEQEDRGEAGFLHLIERLSSRLGAAAVVRMRLLPEAQPERAAIAEPWLTSAQNRQEETWEQAYPEQRPRHRPLRLLSVPVSILVIADEATGLPQRFSWKHREHVVARCEGPEWIETGWWRAPMIRREYCRVETTTGGRFWLFREGACVQWFLQGVFE